MAISMRFTVCSAFSFMKRIDWSTFSCMAVMALVTLVGTVRSHSKGEPTLRRISTQRCVDSSCSFMPARRAVSNDPIAFWNRSVELWLVAVLIILPNS